MEWSFEYSFLYLHPNKRFLLLLEYRMGWQKSVVVVGTNHQVSHLRSSLVYPRLFTCVWLIGSGIDHVKKNRPRHEAKTYRGSFFFLPPNSRWYTKLTQDYRVCIYRSSRSGNGMLNLLWHRFLLRTGLVLTTCFFSNNRYTQPTPRPPCTIHKRAPR
jgi:hypothetical protein